MIDGEGSFIVKIRKAPSNNLKFGVTALRDCFEIELHKRDKFVLEQLKEFFGGVGTIFDKNTRDICLYSVSRINDVFQILEHFQDYPLMTKKKSDYILFEKVARIVKNKEHLNEQGLQKIIDHRASINLGLSEDLKKAFPLTRPVPKPIIEAPKTFDPY